MLELWERVPGAGGLLGIDRIDTLDLRRRMLHARRRLPARGRVRHRRAGRRDEDADPERAAVLLEHRGRLRNRTHGGAMDDFARALALLPEGAAVSRGRLLGLMAMGSLPADTQEARRLGAEALRIGRETGEMTVLVRGLLVTGLLTARADMLSEARTLTEAHGDHDLMLTAAMYASMHHGESGEPGRAAEAALEGLRLALMRGDETAAREAAGAADAIAAALDEPGVRLFPRYRLRLLLAPAPGASSPRRRPIPCCARPSAAMCGRCRPPPRCGAPSRPG
ncbi:hypothetical protein AB0I28_29605 [Phytomonospora sp. NPDC050363]|uniref:hypothetical protein n=1 Tax=Phytomonospora sp. NPDC050363 TaxID=3155642 RepID=UPI0033C371EA